MPLLVALILLAAAAIIVVVLMRRANVDPKEWAKRHPGAEDDELNDR